MYWTVATESHLDSSEYLEEKAIVLEIYFLQLLAILNQSRAKDMSNYSTSLSYWVIDEELFDERTRLKQTEKHKAHFMTIFYHFIKFVTSLNETLEILSSNMN